MAPPPRDGPGDDDLPARRSDGDVQPAGPTSPQAPGGDSAELEAPGGLLGLLLWPLRAAISLGLQIFAAFVNGVLGAFLPGRGKGDAQGGAGSDRAGAADADPTEGDDGR